MECLIKTNFEQIGIIKLDFKKHHLSIMEFHQQLETFKHITRNYYWPDFRRFVFWAWLNVSGIKYINGFFNLDMFNLLFILSNKKRGLKC